MLMHANKCHTSLMHSITVKMLNKTRVLLVSYGLQLKTLVKLKMHFSIKKCYQINDILFDQINFR